MHTSNLQPEGKLQAQFTVWLEKVVIHAKIDYLRTLKQNISLEDLPEDLLAVEDKSISEAGFDFENEQLASAFITLPDLRRQILTLIFVEQLPARKVARILGCPADYVYKQKHRALRKLRDLLMNRGDERD